MNRVTRGTVVLVAAVAMVSCSGDPTSGLRNGVDHLVAIPSAIYVGNNTTKTVLITAVDAQGNALASNFSIGSVGAGITVTPDDSFNLVYNTDGKLVPPKNWTRAQFIVATTVFDSSSFVITAGGHSISIPVRTAAAALTGAITDTTPGNGDTVTITAPANLSFDPAASAVSFGPFAAVVLSRTDTTITFVPPPAASGPATVTEVSLNYAPSAGTFSVPTAQNFHVAPFPALISTPTTALVGDTITVTIPAPFKWTAASHLKIPGASAIVVTSVSTDSSTVKFRIGPNADTTISIDSTVVSGVPTLGRYELATITKLQSPLVPAFPVTFNKPAPSIGDTVVITAAAGFKFLPTASFTVEGATPVILSRAADSSAITFIPYPLGGIAKQLTLSDVVFTTATDLPLILPSSGTFKAPSGYAGTDAFATAPTIPVPAAGQSITVVDAGAFANPTQCTNDLGGPCRVYKIVVAASTTLAMNISWQGTTDIGVYTYDNTQTLAPSLLICDAKGAGASGQPETCSKTFAPGTYYLAVDSFAPFYPSPNNVNPSYFKMVLTGS